MYISFQDEFNSYEKFNYNKVVQKMVGIGNGNGQDNFIFGVVQCIYKGVGKLELQVKIVELNGVQVVVYLVGLEILLQCFLNIDQ